MLKSVLRPQFN